jgi:hypothetical protein
VGEKEEVDRDVLEVESSGVIVPYWEVVVQSDHVWLVFCDSTILIRQGI